MSLVYFIRSSIPSGSRVSIETEKEYKGYRIDVLATYYRAYKPKQVVLYEVQKDLSVAEFREKMVVLGCNNAEIIPLEKAPDTIDELESWIKDYVIIP